MKHIITLCTFLVVSIMSFAQEPEFKDLRILYADANYEKLATEAEKYTLKDKTSKLAAPYFWLAKGLYKISKSGTDDDDFKNAYKDAIKHLTKGIKYDLKYNDGDYAREEADFVELFKLSLYEMTYNEISSKSYKRAYSWALKYAKLTNDETGSKYMMGACKFYDEDKTSARDLWNEGDDLLEKIESIESWGAADKNMLKMGILFSAKALNKSRQEDKARALVGKVSQWYEDDTEWQSQYDAIVNGGDDDSQ
jgi:hypothetical protein